METTKAFATEDVLGTITGVLLGDIGRIYEVLNWMTGESVYTHQLPRIGREAQPVVLAAHPELQSALDERDQVNPSNWEEWRDRWIERFGKTIDVPKFAADEHERKGPITELSEMIPPEKIVAVKL